MISQPNFRTHEEQQAMLGCAANLDPEKYPRRYAQHQARIKHEKEIRSQIVDAARAVEIEEKLEHLEHRNGDKYAMVERAKWYADVTMKEAAEAMGISYDVLRKLKQEFGLQFRSGYVARYEEKDD